MKETIRKYYPSLTAANLGRKLLVAALALALALPGCSQVPQPASSFDARVVTEWYELSLQLVKETPGYTPPVVSRAYGYMGVALYETVRPGMPGYRSLTGQLNDLDLLPQPEETAVYNWPIAANSALASITRKLFPSAAPEHQAAIAELEQKLALKYYHLTDPATFVRSISWGLAVADAVYVWSISDGGHAGYDRNFPDSYEPPTGPGLWKSTPPGYLSALQPYWGYNRPFVLEDGEACPAPPPPAYSEAADSAFYAEAREVYDVVNGLTAEQTAIALFWADDPGLTATPPGHWISILNQVIAQQGVALDRAAESYAKLGIGLADSFITCWNTKYEYNLVRPITYIQEVIDAKWNANQITDPVLTPPFPEYTSGHSVQSGTAASILTAVLGEDVSFTDRTHDELGLSPRTFSSFTVAAEEAAISRLYGGIHYRSAIENGLDQGRCVADKVLALTFQE